VEVEKVWLAFKIQGLNSSDTPVFEAIQGLLTEGRNGRLNRALVDAGIATSVGSGSIALRDPSLFLVEADLQKGKTALLAESVILRELERLKNSPVKTEELKRATNVMRFRFMSRLLTSHGRAHVLGQFETENGSVEAGLAQQEQVYSVTPEQIQETAKRVFQTAKLTVITGVPKSATAGKDQP
jgi:zinc protease